MIIHYFSIAMIIVQQISCLTFPRPPLPPFQMPVSIQQIFHPWKIPQIPPLSPITIEKLAEYIPFITKKPYEVANQTTPLPLAFIIQYPIWQIMKQIPEKIQHFARLVRIQNICPVIALSMASGLTIHPTIPQSIRHVRSSKFAIAVINIILVMSASMIINDLYDIPLDKINNPSRPLVSGKITIPEAKGAICILMAISEMLVIRYLPIHAQIGNHLSILGVILYTPYLKRMLIIKNLFCAGLISYSLLFAGLANSAILTLTGKNRKLFISMFSLIFAHSFQKEILLDILDYEGDKANNIVTIATKYGRYNAYLIAYIGITASVFLNSWVLLGMYGPIGIVFSYIMNPLLMALPFIYIGRYSRNSIRKYDRFSMKILGICLVYFAILSKWPII